MQGGLHVGLPAYHPLSAVCFPPPAAHSGPVLCLCGSPNSAIVMLCSKSLMLGIVPGSTENTFPVLESESLFSGLPCKLRTPSPSPNPVVAHWPPFNRQSAISNGSPPRPFWFYRESATANPHGRRQPSRPRSPSVPEVHRPDPFSFKSGCHWSKKEPREL